MLRMKLILEKVESIPKALELARDSLRKLSVEINEVKFNTLSQEVNLLNRDGDFKKYGNEYIFNPESTIRKGEVAFESDFLFSPLVPIKKNNNYGYINSKGILVIPYSYDYASPFRENIAIVKKNMKWMLIDTNNIKVAEVPNADTLFPNYNMLVPYFLHRNDFSLFEDDLYMYNLKDSLSRFYGENLGLDSAWNMEAASGSVTHHIFPRKYEDLRKAKKLYFSNGRILVQGYPYHGDFVADYNGNILDMWGYDSSVVSLSTGIISVEKGNLWGYYDLKTKEEIISPRYKWVENFVFSYAIVETSDNKYGIIDRNNHSHVNFGDWKIERLSNNLLKFKNANRKSHKKVRSFITDASLNCVKGTCMTTD